MGYKMDPADWRRLASVALTDFRKFLRSQAGDIAALSLE